MSVEVAMLKVNARAIPTLRCKAHLDFACPLRFGFERSSRGCVSATLQKRTGLLVAVLVASTSCTAILLAPDISLRGPVVIDRGGLDVNDAEVERMRADDVVGYVARVPAGSPRPCEP